MTTIDGERSPGSIPNVDGATLTRLEAWSVSTGRSRAELVRLLVEEHAPPVDAGNMTPGSPGDGRGAGGVAATPAPVSHAAPAHVHLGGGPCVFGERCGQ